MANSSISCRSCGEKNSEDMAFCIFCGASLQAPSAQPASTPAEAAVSDGAARQCVGCGKEDRLNGKFCIFCGASIEADQPKKHGKETSGFFMDNELANLKQDLQEKQSGKTTGTNQSLALSGLVSIFAAVLLGLAGGASVAAIMLAMQPSQPKVAIKQGLALLTDKPFSSVLLEMANKQDYMFGKLGKTGNMVLDDLPPGRYHVSLSCPDGKITSADVHVQDGKPEVVEGL